MTSNRPFTLVAAAIFGLMALVHAYRLVSPFEVTVGPCHLPMWVSWIAILITGGLSFGLFREARR